MLSNPNHRTPASPPSRKARSFPTEKEQPRMRAKTRSKSQPKSLVTSIVDSTKDEITRTATKAKALATAAEAVLLFLKDPTIKQSDDSDDNTLRSAASLTFQMKAVVAKIEDFDSYIYNQFQKPELKDSPDRETLFRDVSNTLLGSGADGFQKKLAAQIAEVESVLMGYGQTLSSFQPSNQPQDPHVRDPRDDMENYINEPHLSQETITLVNELPCSLESPVNSRRITSSQSRDLLMMFSNSASPDRTKELQQSLTSENRGLQEENAKHLRAQYKESQNRLALEMKDLQYREYLQAELTRVQGKEDARTAQLDQLVEQSEAQERANQRPAAVIIINSPLPPFEQSSVRTNTAPAVESFEPSADNRVALSSAQLSAMTTFSQRKRVQETPILHSVNQINNTDIEPRTAEAPNATNRLDMNDVMNAFLSIYQNQRTGAHIQERDESIRSRATSRRTQNSIPTRSESSHVRRYERGESSELEDESIHQVPSRTATIRGNRSRSSEPIPRRSGLPIEVRLKLLQKFDGTGDFDLFQTLFTSFVLDDDELSPEAKRAVLMNHITGPATICVSHAKDSRTAIAATFIALNKVYGKVNSKHNLLRKLESLPFHQTDPETMRRDAVSLANVLQQLKDRGVPADDHMTMLAIACKLPESMQKSLAKYSIKRDEKLTHDLILDRISRDIEIMALEQTYVSQNNIQANELTDSYTTVNFANSNSSRERASTQSNKNNPRENRRKLVYEPSQHPSEYVDPITNSKLEGYYAPGPKGVNVKILHRTFPFAEKETRSCHVCQEDHNEIRCTLNSNEFRERCKMKGLCPICTRKHNIKACESRYRCGYCDGLHHSGGCPQKEFYRDKNNYPKGAQPVATLFRANKANQLK
ncbi:hypothetical protein CRE_12243 [Caenorhabditis remanei]|uniref:Uncharacterized protein n=1 Tax=Caenorhabditis remanei TaxID=31234 RepID=E3N721_CAERE|nr:hypothetical protein CRE_12243 [Caenorhabditis remanei]